MDGSALGSLQPSINAGSSSIVYNWVRNMMSKYAAGTYVPLPSDVDAWQCVESYVSPEELR